MSGWLATTWLVANSSLAASVGQPYTGSVPLWHVQELFMRNSARYEAVWVNGTWVVRDRHMWSHLPVLPPLEKVSKDIAAAKNAAKVVH